MSRAEVESHFWVAGAPFFSSTIMVAPSSKRVGNGRCASAFTLFDVDGAEVNSFQVEFPDNELGVVELEPFATGLKMQSGIAQGHIVVRSPRGTRHFCRQGMGAQFDLIPAPQVIQSRESVFIPLILGARREHLLVLVNTSSESGQIIARLFYGTRSPEWTLPIPANGCSVIALEDELLRDFDDASWHKGAMQGYLRFTARANSRVLCQMIERVPGESEDKEYYRCLRSW